MFHGDAVYPRDREREKKCLMDVQSIISGTRREDQGPPPLHLRCPFVIKSAGGDGY